MNGKIQNVLYEDFLTIRLAFATINFQGISVASSCRW